jgi:hypothetical protein
MFDTDAPKKKKICCDFCGQSVGELMEFMEE